MRLQLYAALLCGASLAFAAPANAEMRHALAMHGEPAEPEGFKSFSFVNPDAPKGGRFVIGILGSFDSLNPYAVRGNSITALRTYVYAPLMMRSYDEPFTLYPLIASSIDVPEDRSSVTFYINPKAKFSDGHALTADDVIFSWQLLKEKGWPNQRAHYSKIESAERVGDNVVKFSFPNAHDRELPLIMASMVVLPKHALNGEKFDQMTLERPIAAGPYVVDSFETGNSATLKRISDWWAKDLPSTRGLYNFDEVRFEFYRDDTSLFEAFKKGLVDVRAEGDPARWSRDYDFPAVRNGQVKLETIKSGLPAPMQAYVFNTRRALFADGRVREALITLFDFEWMNANLFDKTYERTESFFQGSELSSFGKPASLLEKTYLAEAKASLPPAFLDGTWKLPISDASGHDRALVRKAISLLNQAGYEAKNGRLVSKKTGQPFSFEVMTETRDQERVLLTWKKALGAIGIDMRVRQVDSAQAERRRQNFDFDMVFWNYIGSLSPGNEQMIRWGSKTADQPGSVNLAGVKDPAVDALLDRLVAATTREELVAATRALDRVLMAGNYVLPLYNLPAWQIAHWARIKLPKNLSLSGSMMESWWYAKDSKEGL
jgi:peptide/nickel transport system substrate-binding protein